MRYEHITLECIEGVATITINRPEVLNALSMQTLDEMMDALDSVAAMGARTLLLRGAGRAFARAPISAAAFKRILNALIGDVRLKPASTLCSRVWCVCRLCCKNREA